MGRAMISGLSRPNVYGGHSTERWSSLKASPMDANTNPLLSSLFVTLLQQLGLDADAIG